MEQYFAEKHNLKVLSNGVDMSAAASASPRVFMGTADRMTLIVLLGAGAGPATVQGTLQQANAATGGTAKPLNFFNPRYAKAVTDTVFTKFDVIDDENGDVMIDASPKFSTAAGILIIEVLAEDLDRDNGFDYIELDFAKSGTVSKTVTILAATSYDRQGPAYQNVL